MTRSYDMTQTLTERESYIAFNMLDRIGPVRARKLIQALGSPEAVFHADAVQLCGVPGIGKEIARSIIESRAKVDPVAEEEKADRLGIRIVTFIDSEYPDALKEIHDPPLALYVKGELIPADKHSIAVVGTRHATHYGKHMADLLSYGLSKAGFTIVSGLARGIDTIAHRAALKAGGRTVAVIGSAIDKLYPPENKDLAEELAGQGALVSEYPLGRPPDRQTFPYRNRIVSGMSTGILVVEAGQKSGAVITANSALDQGRHVYAVPGRVDSPTARGCHSLIKQGAKLIETIDDVIDDLQFLIPKKIEKNADSLKKSRDVNLSPEETAVVKALAQGEQHVDILSRTCGLNAARLNALLLGLEMKRVIRIQPGRFVALREGLNPI